MDVVTLDEAKARINETSQVDDEEIQTFIDASVGVAEGFLGGALVTRTETVRLPGNAFLFYLPVRPVLSVESVVDSWTGLTLDTTGLWIDPWVGRVAFTPFGNVPLGYFPPDITVNYTVGWPGGIPPVIKDGVLEIIRHKWETQRGSSMGRPAAGFDESPDYTVRFEHGLTIPLRAKESLAPYRLPIA